MSDIVKTEVEVDTDITELFPDRNSIGSDFLDFSLELVRIDGIALTDTGKLTRARYFNKMDVRNQIYVDMTFTKEEAQGIQGRMGHLSTGVNSVTALKCMGAQCSFAADCPYQQIGKAPLGKSCLIEVDLLLYHSQRFMKEFEVDPEDHTEILLVQELSELVIYEMRVARVLATPENALLFQEEIKMDKEGNEIRNEQIHWAWELKDKIKNRRMKILDALNATRKSKNIQADNGPASFGDFVKTLTDKMDKIQQIQNTEEVDAVYDVSK